MSRLEDYDTTVRFEATVKETVRITPEDIEDEARHMVLETNKEDFKFEVGQSIGVLVPGPHEFGNEDHLRLYSIAEEAPAENGGSPTIAICVKRCSYVDEYSGERYQGVASNYLCDRQPGDKITLTGPYGGAFRMPDDPSANILMIGLGTGIAPFRAFIRHIYNTVGEWKGDVRLFYGARTGLELLYMNKENDDLLHYYDQATFKAFQSVSPRPHVDAPIALDRSIEENSEEVWKLLQDPNTYVYVAGIEKIRELLDTAMAKLLDSEEKWLLKKAEMEAGGRWSELLY